MGDMVWVRSNGRVFEVRSVSEVKMQLKADAATGPLPILDEIMTAEDAWEINKPLLGKYRQTIPRP